MSNLPDGIRRLTFEISYPNGDGELHTIRGVTREKIGADAWNELVVLHHIGTAGLDKEHTPYLINKFVDCILQTESIEGLPFEWPSLMADTEAIANAFHAWRGINYDVMQAWGRTLLTLQNAPTLPEDDKKKADTGGKTRRNRSQDADVVRAETAGS